MSPFSKLWSAGHGTWRGWVRHLLAKAAWRLGLLRSISSGRRMPAGRLVFVCLGNINRSAFGAAMARQLGEPAVSIGLSTDTGTGATPMAVAEARSRGVDLASHRATDIRDFEGRDDDVYLVMEIRHARQLLARGIPASRVCFLGLWSDQQRVHVHDPHTLSEAYFHTCFGIIESAVRRLVAQRKSGGT
jgi:protein-tyrosine phosphatase